MPIKIQSDLPVKEILEQENIFVMDDTRAMHQDIRPIQILILNLMPLKEETELQLLRSLSNTPLQIDVTFMAVASHEAKNTSRSHLNKFYISFEQVKEQKFDGMIITGAPVEQMEFEEVDYWEELTEIMEWSKSHVTSTIHLCWGAQAGLYYHYGLKKRQLSKKMFGLFWHEVQNRKIPLVRGFDDLFLAPHSRHTEVSAEDIHNCKALTVLAESREAGVFLCMYATRFWLQKIYSATISTFVTITSRLPFSFMKIFNTRNGTSIRSHCGFQEENPKIAKLIPTQKKIPQGNSSRLSFAFF